MRKLSPEVLSALKEIQADDPDSWGVEPKPHHYAAHEAYSIKRYGQEVWGLYVKGGWNR